MSSSRRTFLSQGAAAVTLASSLRAAGQATHSNFLDIVRPPDRVIAYPEDSAALQLRRTGERWRGQDVEVTTEAQVQGANRRLSLKIASPQTSLRRVMLRWLGSLPETSRFLGDHWERSYGDLEWRSFAGERVMPWYFLMTNGRETHGYGVMTGARAFCFWQVDPSGISLWLDVRNGGSGVQLGERELAVAEVVAVEGQEGLSAFAAARSFCRRLCPRPRLPAKPVYGSNNWYYLYGENMTAENVLSDADQVSELSLSLDDRPFMVIDMGWGKAAEGAGPWTADNSRFDMPRTAEEIKKRHVRPGVWLRPVLTVETLPPTWQLNLNHSGGPLATPLAILDPSNPDALEHIRQGLHQVIGWGFELIKHDFSTYDLLGRWGFEMGAALTSDGWHFGDRSRTTAEILLELYRAIREAAGNVILIGCNTVGHLGAGTFEVQRIGDDTSGRDWNRTRKMGVNALGFRLPQHRTFFLADGDCVPLTKSVPLNMTRQWLDLVTRTGTPLFTSADPSTAPTEEKRLLRAAYSAAARVQNEAEPLDWTETMSPGRWRFGGTIAEFDWFGQEGADPFSH